VRVRYRDKKLEKRIRLAFQDFLRRYLQHVLPIGFNKVRHYGPFAPGNAARLKALRHQLQLTQKIRFKSLLVLVAISLSMDSQRCPVCGKGIMQRVLSLMVSSRNHSPP
jgi:hypothetical protein